MEGSHERESEDTLLVVETAGGGGGHSMYKNKRIICQDTVHFMSPLSANSCGGRCVLRSDMESLLPTLPPPSHSRLIVTLQSDSDSNAEQVHQQRAFLCSLCARVRDSSIQSHFSREIITPFFFFNFRGFRIITGRSLAAALLSLSEKEGNQGYRHFIYLFFSFGRKMVWVISRGLCSGFKVIHYTADLIKHG